MSAAEEINRKFWRKMARGGHIDRILAGGVNPNPQPALPDEEIKRIKLNIEIQMAEYTEAADAAAKWYAEWKLRNRSGFRCKRS